MKINVKSASGSENQNGDYRISIDLPGGVPEGCKGSVRLYKIEGIIAEISHSIMMFFGSKRQELSTDEMSALGLTEVPEGTKYYINTTSVEKWKTSATPHIDDAAKELITSDSITTIFASVESYYLSKAVDRLTSVEMGQILSKLPESGSDIYTAITNPPIFTGTDGIMYAIWKWKLGDDGSGINIQKYDDFASSTQKNKVGLQLGDGNQIVSQMNEGSADNRFSNLSATKRLIQTLKESAASKDVKFKLKNEIEPPVQPQPAPVLIIPGSDFSSPIAATASLVPSAVSVGSPQSASSTASSALNVSEAASAAAVELPTVADSTQQFTRSELLTFKHALKSSKGAGQMPDDLQAYFLKTLPSEMPEETKLQHANRMVNSSRCMQREREKFLVAVDLPIDEEGVTVKKYYVVWTRDISTEAKPNQQAINFQELYKYQTRSQNEKVGVVIDDQGLIQSVCVDNQILGDVKQVPTENNSLLIMKALFNKSCEVSSEYSAGIITLVEEGLSKVPEFHLNKLIATTKLLNTNFPCRLNLPRINFLNPELTPGNGIDAGGLTRTYFSSLGTGLVGLEKYFIKKGGEDHLPGCSVDRGELSKEQLNFYQNFGGLLTLCYRSDSPIFTLGRLVNDNLFEIVQSLDATEVNTPFNTLPVSAKIKMYKVKLLSEDDPPECFKLIVKCLTNVPDPIPSDLTALKQAARKMAGIPDGVPDVGIDNCQTVEAVNAKIIAYIKQLGSNGGLEKEIMDEWNNVDDAVKGLSDYMFTRVSNLAPIHAIAQGMKESFMSNSALIAQKDQQWNHDIKNLNTKEFSAKIQGVFDRSKIVGGLENSEIAAPPALARYEWIKQWMTNDKDTPTSYPSGQLASTQDQLKKFLIFVTGSNSLAKDGKITITQQAGIFDQFPASATKHSKSPGLIAHTCWSSVEVGFDWYFDTDTNLSTTDPETMKARRDAFIAQLEADIENPSAFTMG